MKIKLPEPNRVDFVYQLPNSETLTVSCTRLLACDVVVDIDFEQKLLMDKCGIKYECC